MALSPSHNQHAKRAAPPCACSPTFSLAGSSCWRCPSATSCPRWRRGCHCQPCCASTPTGGSGCSWRDRWSSCRLRCTGSKHYLVGEQAAKPGMRQRRRTLWKNMAATSSITSQILPTRVGAMTGRGLPSATKVHKWLFCTLLVADCLRQPMACPPCKRHLWGPPPPQLNRLVCLRCAQHIHNACTGTPQQAGSAGEQECAARACILYHTVRQPCPKSSGM